MKQIISKDKKVYCTTTVPYSKEVIKQLKAAKYKIKEIEDEKQTENSKGNNK